MHTADAGRTRDRISFQKTLAALGIAALAAGGILSLFASSLPDGLDKRSQYF